MTGTLLLVAILLVMSWPARANASAVIAFGSCLQQWKPQPIWQGVLSVAPRAFIFLGDNVYTDVGRYREMPEPDRIGAAYRELAASPDYRFFMRWVERNGAALFAVWDDHDYGRNNGGADYPYREQSQQYFQRFFRRGPGGTTAPAGIHQSHRLHLAGLAVQLLLLDTRSFRDPLLYGEPTAACEAPILANPDQSAGILGDSQWRWLEEQLREPADMRLIASSIQVLPTEHCYEKWANFPAERARLFHMIRQTGAEGVIFLSGDRHLGEISWLPDSPVGYPLFEITSSGLNSAVGDQPVFQAEKNSLRATDRNVTQDNFGSLAVETTETGVELRLQIRNQTGRLVQEKRLPLGSLRRQPSE